MTETKQEIRDRMLDSLSPLYRKSEGEFVYDVLAAAAIELERAYAMDESILNKGFADTAYAEYLDKLCVERGISRKAATHASGIVFVTGAPFAVLPVGSLVASDTVQFRTQKRLQLDEQGNGSVNVICEAAGRVGNVPSGAIKSYPITIEGFYTVTNPNPFTNGYNEESDEELRKRYYIKVRTPATSGNKYHYINWALEVAGVGGAKVFPLYYGRGTVRVVILNEEKRAADKTLCKSVWEHIEQLRPIGAEVTVESAKEKEIYLSVQVLYDNENNSLEDIQQAIQEKIQTYFKDISFEENYVSHAKVGSFLLTILGVLDYTDLRLNETASNIPLEVDEIPVLGGVVIA